MSSNKRGSIFGQGKAEQPYEDRDEPADVPQRATAAQLASRKIKTAKARRPAGASGLSQSANLGAPQPNSFNFGASAPASAPADNGANGFGGFGGNNAFGGATNSFPPAQQSAPSNNFSSSSFPAFGASNQSTGFNPQPPSSTGFNFTTGGANPFATPNSTPAKNGNAPAPAFGASSMFNTAQPQNNPFGGLGQNTNASSAPSGGMFGASSGASNATSAPSTASTPFTFGPASTSAQNNMSTPATSGLFSGFATSAQPLAPMQNKPFGGFGTNAQTPETPKEPAASHNNLFAGFGSHTDKGQSNTDAERPQNSVFGGFGTSAQGVPSATATAPASSLFDFGAAAQKTDNPTSSAPSTSLFGISSSAAPSASTPASASNPFAKLPTATNTASTPFSGFGAASQTPQAPGEAPATPTNLFSNLKKPVESSSGTAAETPKPNPFAGVSKPANTAAATPSASTPGFSIFGAAKNKDATSASAEQGPSAATLQAPEAPKPSVFQPFSTPQPAKKNDAEKSHGGVFSAAQPKTSSGIFSQTFPPETNNASSLFKKPQSSFPSFAPQTNASTEAPKATPTQQSLSKEVSNPFSSLSTPSSGRPNLFTASKDATAPAPAAPPAMPKLTGSPALSTGPELPKIPKVHVPKEWAVPGAISVHSSDGLFTQISDLTAQLQLLNEKYRQQLTNLPPTADWSSISLWHHQHATDIKKKIDNAKKQRAAGKGITGNESSLSTKRKVSDESPENRDPSPSKRARASEAFASPAPQPTALAPKFNPPATATSNMFAKAIGNKPSTPSTSGWNSPFAPPTTEKQSAEPSKPAASVTGFQFTPSVPASNGTTSAKPTPSSGFKPSFGGGSSSGSNFAGFNPSFGSAPTGAGGGLMAQFTKTAKTYEELAAERKKKAKDEDYDSDDETEEQWSARYDKAEEERLAEEKKKIAATPKFNVPGAAKLEAQPSGNSSPNPFASLLKPASGASTPALFAPKAASPAPSTGNQSVFNAPNASQTPSSNIFGHLSSGPSSNNQDESDEDDSEQHQPVRSVEPSTPPKRRFGESETESEETGEDSTHKKQDTGSKGSLLSRITRDNDSGSERESSETPAAFVQTNGTTTPSNKPFAFFDFGAASKPVTPKSDTFAGDQTFKVGTPIKFGEGPATEKDGPPKFQFQPATPAAAEFSNTPAKPPPSSIFNFASSTGGSSLLAPNAGLSGANSVTSSVFSSRAGTPLSEAGDTSAASAAEDEEEKQEQVDFSRLTPEEINAYDIVFHTEVVLAKHQIDKGGEKAWANLAKGPLWILKDKETAKCSVRVRIASGATPLNYQILPSLPATVTGSSRKMVMTTKPAKEGGLQSVLYAVKTPEIAEEMAAKYMESRPSA